MHRAVVIQVDREQWAKLLTEAVSEAVARDTGDSEIIEFIEDPSEADLILCLGSEALCQSSNARSKIAVSLANGVRVLPIVSELSRFEAEIPPELRAINGMAWGDVSAIAEEVLLHLGVTERDRRVFLSYLRSETTNMAYQLHDELHRRRFSVFLDSLDIEPGEFVQPRIEEALQQTSFVLLLYSTSVETSEWIEKEINFALAQELGLVALSLPGTKRRLPFQMTPSDRRIELKSSELAQDGKLTPSGLDRVCVEIGREHSDQFRSRRERMIRDLRQSLGTGAVRVGGQSLRYAGVNSDVFIRLSPRPPEARDLYLLDEDCPIAQDMPGQPKRVLVSIKGGYRASRELTEWICGNLKHEVLWREPQAVCADSGVLEQ